MATKFPVGQPRTNDLMALVLLSPALPTQLAVHMSLNFIFHLKVVVIFYFGHNKQLIEQEMMPPPPLPASFEFYLAVKYQSLNGSQK